MNVKGSEYCLHFANPNLEHVLYNVRAHLGLQRSIIMYPSVQLQNKYLNALSEDVI